MSVQSWRHEGAPSAPPSLPPRPMYDLMVYVRSHWARMQVSMKCREMAGEMLRDLSDRGTSRIVMCQNSSMDALDR
eukprot:5324989-Pyramimonas_sp.AAC.1